MSTLKTTNLQNPSAASPAIVLAADGSATAQLSSLNGGPLSGARNRIINGDMRIDQRNAGASVTTHLSYPVDRFVMYKDTASLGLSAQRVTDAPAGFSHSLRVTTTTAATPAAAEGNSIAQSIEGLNIYDLAFGTGSASSFTLSFWIKSSVTGTFGGGLTNSGANRWRAFSYTITAANTWEFKSVTVPGDTAGTWATDTGVGLRVFFSLGTGSSFAGSTTAWGTSTSVTATGAIGINSTLNATWQITGVQLEAGTVATPFERRPYGQELALCQRYFASLDGDAESIAGPWGSFYSTTSCRVWRQLPVPMRTTPTLACTGLVFDRLGVGLTTASSIGNVVLSPEIITFDGITCSPSTDTFRGTAYHGKSNVSAEL